PNDPRSRHVFDFLAMVERVEPRAFVMENVKALAKNRRWSGTIADIREQAKKIGYKTYLEVLNSSGSLEKKWH
ncbi:MAG: DNA cytosine methyltransferase, partial [Bacillus sp. (in: Bacteria)]|nr:DNA cytosine methyltransferase [Bacillus sp. (in: firmicutes)]